MRGEVDFLAGFPTFSKLVEILSSRSNRYFYYEDPPFSRLQIGLFVLVGIGFLWNPLFKGGHGGSGLTSYANLRIAYSWHERGVLSQRVKWLVVLPHELFKGSSSGEDGIVIELANGETWKVTTETKHLVWIAADGTLTETSIPLTKEFLDQIQQAKAGDPGLEVDSPEMFLKLVSEE